MRSNNHYNRRKVDTGINAGAEPPACTAEQRKTMREGLRILARMIVRAHLRREASRAESSPQESPSANQPHD